VVAVVVDMVLFRHKMVVAFVVGDMAVVAVEMDMASVVVVVVHRIRVAVEVDMEEVVVVEDTVRMACMSMAEVAMLVLVNNSCRHRRGRETESQTTADDGQS